uniref:Phosphoribosylglycinamide transformylase n=1 Tax=Acetithermum autotrophicum TaxID=1446466 RepID=H5SRS1_ACEAU|nr:phosphoribosylglycinamide transformylase [Candidatus Acetothermum autotrophicum]
MRRFQFGILTSLHDDDAVTLLRALDSAIGSGRIDADVPCVLCNVSERPSNERLAQRIEAVKALKSFERLIFFPSREFAPELRERARREKAPELLARWRLEHDRALLALLPRDVKLYLSVGYMQILSSEILNALDVLNLHPAIPQIGPIGMWPKVMEEQAERPLPYLLAVPPERLAQEIPEIMNISYLKAGGMLHIATEETDRGPVISWYEFPLSSQRLIELWVGVTALVRAQGLERAKREPMWNELVQQIRREQFAGETPLILLTLEKLSRGLWEIRERTLCINGKLYPYGYCLNRELREWSRPPS